MNDLHGDFQICELYQMRVVRKLTIYIMKIQCIYSCVAVHSRVVILFVVNCCLLLLPLWMVIVLWCSSFCPYWLCGPESPHHLKASDSALLRIFRRPNGKCTSIPSPCACLSGVLVSTGAYYSRSMRQRGGRDNAVFFHLFSSQRIIHRGP